MPISVWILMATTLLLFVVLVVVVYQYMILRKLVDVYKMSYTTLHTQFGALEEDYDKVVDYVIQKHINDPKHPTKKPHKKTVNKSMLLSDEQREQLLAMYKKIKETNKKHEANTSD